MAMDLDELLNGVKNGTISIESAKAKIKAAPFIDLDYAKLDMHRRLRTGMSEVVFCQGKADDFLVKIVSKFLEVDGEVSVRAAAKLRLKCCKNLCRNFNMIR